MEVKCSICGKKEEITKIHKDYQKLAANPELHYVCWNCENRMRFQAQKMQKPRKLM